MQLPAALCWPLRAQNMKEVIRPVTAAYFHILSAFFSSLKQVFTISHFGRLAVASMRCTFHLKTVGWLIGQCLFGCVFAKVRKER